MLCSKLHYQTGFYLIFFSYQILHVHSLSQLSRRAAHGARAQVDHVQLDQGVQVHPTPYTLHPTPYAPRPTPHTLNPEP